MNEIAIFDYSTLPSDDAEALRCAAERINVRGQRLIEDIAEIGRELIDAKARVGHGRFLPWIEASFGMSDDTARNFMNVAEVYGDKIRIVRDLPLGAVYALAAPSTPDSVRSEVAGRAAKGELVTAAEIRQLKSEAAAAHALRDANAVLMSDKAELADRVVELKDQMKRLSNAPSVITVEPDQAALDRQYEAFLAHWRSLQMELRERFFAEHSTPFAARSVEANGADEIPTFLKR